MFRDGTLFVLGAGASAPYGFPVGAVLRDRLKNLNDSSVGKFLIDNGLTNKGQLESFCRELNLSGQVTIDEFISKRTDWQEFGKLAVAATLCDCENHANVFPSGGGVVVDDWYRVFWNKMQYGTRNSSDIEWHNFRVITFNYDRSLEYFLHNAMKASYGLDSESVAGVMRYAQIQHVYGMLGSFGYVDSVGVNAYSGNLTVDRVKLAAEGIGTISDSAGNRVSDGNIETIREWVNLAKQICFLGFGFDDRNVALLGFSKSIKSKGAEAKSVYVTASMLNQLQNDWNALRAKYFLEVSSDPSFSNCSGTLSSFLKVRG